MKRKREDDDEHKDSKRQKLDYIKMQKEKWNKEKNVIDLTKEPNDKPPLDIPEDKEKQIKEDEYLARKLQGIYEKEEKEIKNREKTDYLLAIQLSKENEEDQGNEEEDEGEDDDNEKEHHPIRVEKLLDS